MSRWRCICDRCGSKKWNDELRKEWTGLMVCAVGCWEPRHPQDRVRGKADRQAPPWVRPEPADVFLATSLLLREDGSSFLLEVPSAFALAPEAIAREID